MSPKVWIDGKISDPRDAKVSVYDHGFLYGDGVFEGVRVYNGRIFECAAHVARLYDSAKAIRLVIPYTREQVCAVMEETIKASGFRDAYIRLPYFDTMHRYLPALIRRGGGTTVEVPVDDRPRLKGRSKYGFFDRLADGMWDLPGVFWLCRRARVPDIEPSE